VSAVPAAASPLFFMRRVPMALGACAVALLTACASAPGDRRPLVSVSLPSSASVNEAARLRWLDRVGWGANASSEAQLAQRGLSLWMRDQLNPRPAPLPPAAQAQIDAMAISRTPLDQLVTGLDAQRKAADALPDEDQKKAARQAYQRRLNELAREAQQRFVLRALYSPNQLQEQMTWFWMNHFNVNLRRTTSARWWATTKRTRSDRTRSAGFATCSVPRCTTRRCCATSTTPRTPPTASTRTMRAS
jgi:hypothetical protein